MKNILAYVGTIATAAFLGNMLVIGLGYGLYWQSLSPQVFTEQFTLQFPYLLPPTMGLLLPALLSSIVLVIISRGEPVIRRRWAIVLGGIVIACTITAVYHLPTNFGFMDGRYSAGETVSKLRTWVLLHWVRTAVVLISSVYAVKAIHSPE
ncbi:uncharacterized protein DUF1772 [Neolewinella xylanilytica]|uniref:Uncharacterized protein DUF1772 n=1 Tax=Neolewinella xylanilytica TaxID=1514080 RepID=A0A2S6I843_9BACT|nr:DUF1772 domain-containing protein [Neolewinella xylanilytica]PPK87663.1 uncharacterized protein DUF1772 [Neolewinella xylanilytica]